MHTAAHTVFRERAPGDPREVAEQGVANSRERLLQRRIKDLQLHLAGTPLEKHIQQLYAELEAKGITLRPQCYLSDQWGCPSGVPVIGIPFYLADPNLHALESELGAGAETEREIMMYLRHEAGHAFNYAYKLYETEDWKKLFGDFSKPYREDYKAKPFSKKYVVHISGWYAQKHPDEDFAETFAVWLTPENDWQKRYTGWATALKKLNYVDGAAKQLGRQSPPVQIQEKDLDVSQMEETVVDYYRQRDLEEKIDVQLREHLDQDLFALFEGPGTAPARADMMVRAERQSLIAAVTQYSGVSRAVVRSLIDHILDRTTALGLMVQLDKTREYSTKLTALLTALAMNYLYTDRFFELD
ncbi:MAG: putative zinc-binding metallopeptidase [Myxococcaceae bacterium]